MRMIVSLVNCYLTIPNGAKANGFFLPPTPPHMCAVQSSQGSLWNIIFQLSPKTMLIMMSSQSEYCIMTRSWSQCWGWHKEGCWTGSYLTSTGKKRESIWIRSKTFKLLSQISQDIRTKCQVFVLTYDLSLVM